MDLSTILQFTPIRFASIISFDNYRFNFYEDQNEKSLDKFEYCIIQNPYNPMIVPKFIPKYHIQRVIYRLLNATFIIERSIVSE